MGDVFKLIGEGLIVSVCAFVFLTIIYSVVMEYMMRDPRKKEKGMTMLVGELVSITYDKEKGLTRIEVKDSVGVTKTGFSTLSVGQLTSLYKGKGWVQIPCVSCKK